MASSQVEIASSAPFGCVLRDHNQREFSSNARTKILKQLVHSCISDDVNSPNHADTNDENNIRHSRSVMDRQSRQQGEKSGLSCSDETSNLGGVSSLVKRWSSIARARLNLKLNVTQSSSGAGRTNSSEIAQEGPLEYGDYSSSGDERFDTPSMATEDSSVDWESDKTGTSATPSAWGRESTEDAGERERVRVSDVIRKLTWENQVQGSTVNRKTGEHESVSSESSPLRPIACASSSYSGCFSPRIRGRQAVTDLLRQMKRDRHAELAGLAERRPVSKFSQRGRIQALLRLRFLNRDAAEVYQQHSHLMAAGGFHRNLQTMPQHHCNSHPNSNRNSNLRAPRAQEHLCHDEAVDRVGDINNLRKEGAVASKQQSSSVPAGESQQLFSDSTEIVGAQRHSDSREIVRDQQHLDSRKMVGIQQHLYSQTAEGVKKENSNCGESAIRDKQHSHSTPSSESNQAGYESVVMLLREKFDVGADHDAANWRHIRGVAVNNTSDVASSSTSNHLKEDEPVAITSEQQSTSSTRNLVLDTSDSMHGQSSLHSDHLQQGTADGLIGNAEKEKVATSKEVMGTNQDLTSDVPDPQNNLEEQGADNYWMEETDQQYWTSDGYHPWSEWEEQEEDSHHTAGTSLDWINEISRPRSDWEDLRQARYQEMLDPFLKNEEIRQLLERRSVSTFLSSNLRYTVDEVMISRVQIVPYSINNEQEQEGEDGPDIRQILEQLMKSHLQSQTSAVNQQEDEMEEEQGISDREEQSMGPHEERQTLTVNQKEEEEKEEEGMEENREWQEEGVEEEEEEEEVDAGVVAIESTIRHRHNEFGDYAVENGAARSWSHDSDQEISDDSGRVTSSLLQQPPRLSQSSCPEAQPCSSLGNHSSIDMELIYDLRGHMEQLYLEMRELRRSIISCMNMQKKLQRSMKHEVAAAVSRSVREVGKESMKWTPRKGSCCVCYGRKVDSLLYRCGHMCMCFKCAQELQEGRGECPICRAQIVDVVRAYADS